MSEISFNGPVTVSPELMIKLWEAMPELGRSGVAQLFFSRFVSAPISDAAITAGTRVFFEQNKIPAAAVKALRDGVAAKTRELGEKCINVAQVQAVTDDETRKAAAEFAREKMAVLLSAIPLEALVAAATPVVAEVIKAASHHFFTKTQQGQAWLLGLIEKVCEDEADILRTTISDKIIAEADPVARRMAANRNGT